LRESKITGVKIGFCYKETQKEDGEAQASEAFEKEPMATTPLLKQE
jgi:hypothetical protein